MRRKVATDLTENSIIFQGQHSLHNKCVAQFKNTTNSECSHEELQLSSVLAIISSEIHGAVYTYYPNIKQWCSLSIAQSNLPNQLLGSIRWWCFNVDIIFHLRNVDYLSMIIRAKVRRVNIFLFSGFGTVWLHCNIPFYFKIKLYFDRKKRNGKRKKIKKIDHLSSITTQC